MGIIYIWTNKINNKSYVGQTLYPEKRYWQHLNAKDNKPFHNALRKYGVENFEYRVLEDNIENSKLNEREQYWIQYYNTFNNGYNLTLGGESTSGFKFSDDQLKNLSEAHIGQKAWNKGMKMNQEFCNKVSNSLKGRTFKKGKKLSDESRKRLSESHMNQVAWNKKAILMLDKETDEVIREFESLKEACIFLNLTTHSGISQCLTGKLKTAYKYKWKFK